MPPRLTTVHEDDTLLSIAQCCRKLGGIHPKNWPAYAARWEALRDGERIVRVRPDGRGRSRWLRSAVVRHIVVELKRGAAAVPEQRASARQGVA